LFDRGEDARPAVLDLQPLNVARRRVRDLAPLDSLRQNALEGVEFPIDRRRLDRLRRPGLSVRAPLIRDRMIAEEEFGELAERDVRLPANAVAAFENAGPVTSRRSR